jgi:tetratricopeptide (TPR) repeat protein
MAVALYAPAAAQSPADHVARGDSLSAALQPEAALVEFRTALALDSTAYAAWWKAAQALIDIAKQRPDRDHLRRDSLYLEARAAAETAIRIDSLQAEGHFVLAHALGRYARTRGGRERVRYGRAIYDEAARALALDPRHDGAHHVLGAWHAEVRRLSGVTRFLARTLFGAGFLGRASWDSSTAHLERAVELRPDFIYHRLELAQVYLDRHREGDAREQLQRIATLPVQDVMDPTYREEAARLLADALKRRSGPSGAGGGASARTAGGPTRGARRTRRAVRRPPLAPAAPGASA